MPELPEVETTARGLAPLIGSSISKVIIRNYSLRIPIANTLPNQLAGQKLLNSSRRAKYLLLRLERGWLVWHLGMSGSLRLDQPQQPLRVHDHVIIQTTSNYELRYCDPRRFGSLVYCQHSPDELPSIAKLGVEPLDKDFTGTTLYLASRDKNTSIKQLLMDSKIVVGVGNIYAAEALFAAQIDPRLIARRLTSNQATRLTSSIKQILKAAIKAGGTTLRDFINTNSEPGYFSQSLMVYGREGGKCLVCSSRLIGQVIAQRATVWCPSCQKKTDKRKRIYKPGSVVDNHSS